MACYSRPVRDRRDIKQCLDFTRRWKITNAQTVPCHLNGITRQAIIKLAGQKGIEIVEEAFNLADAKKAKEAFVTSASACVKPVIQIDDITIADGKPGPSPNKLQKSMPIF